MIEPTPSHIRAAYGKAIRQHLARWAGKPCVWGDDDCVLAICDIDIDVVGDDPAKDDRGRYGNEAEAIARLGRAGLSGWWSRRARERGWSKIGKRDLKAAQDGDRGVARTLAGVTTVICCAGLWFARVDRGDMTVARSAVLKAWSIC